MAIEGSGSSGPTRGRVVLTEDQARRIAEDYLDGHIRNRMSQEVIVASVREFETAWVFGYNTRAFVEERDFLRSLVGNGPIVVDKQTGSVRIALSGSPIEEQIT